MEKLVFIAAGGAVGALLRYAISGWAQRLWPTHGPWAEGGFPVGTLAVNVIGCLLIGILGAMFAGPTLVREEHRVALLVGVLGAFTTFSTFGWETLQLANDGQIGRAMLNVALANGLGLGAVWIGYRVTERLIA